MPILRKRGKGGGKEKEKKKYADGAETASYTREKISSGDFSGRCRREKGEERRRGGGRGGKKSKTC